MGIPCSGYVPGRQPACRLALTQLVRTLVTYGTVDGIACFVGVSCHGKERQVAVVCILFAEVLCILLLALLEDAVVRERYTTVLVLVTPATEPGILTISRVQLSTAEQADDMITVLTEVTVVADRGTEVRG